MYIERGHYDQISRLPQDILEDQDILICAIKHANSELSGVWSGVMGHRYRLQATTFQVHIPFRLRENQAVVLAVVANAVRGCTDLRTKHFNAVVWALIPVALHNDPTFVRKAVAICGPMLEPITFPVAFLGEDQEIVLAA